MYNGRQGSNLTGKNSIILAWRGEKELSSNPLSVLSFKACLIGDAFVGKTSIRREYLGKSFISSHIATIGVDFAQKMVKVDERPVRLVIWDLAGQDGYQAVRARYYEGATALIVVYDITNRESFQNMSGWLSESFKHVDKVPIAILGNKSDLRTAESKNKFVRPAEGAAFAKGLGERLGVPTVFYETSAKVGENIQEAFTELTRYMIADYEKVMTARAKKDVPRKMM